MPLQVFLNEHLRGIFFCQNNYFPLNENCTKGQYQTWGGEVIFEYMTVSAGFYLLFRFGLFFRGRLWKHI